MASEIERLNQALAGRHRVQRELGRGGMATVYLAHDLKHNRSIALKVLKPELAAALGAERFLREITVTARLDHPHILPLLDSGEADGFLYYVMPYVEGESLRDRLNREKQLPLDETLRIACEVADALSYAHSHGIVHRDIKPENILLAAGHARVADFGIAHAVATAGGETQTTLTKLTATGVAVGTPVYMSPEQAAGERTLDARTDIYALGCVLYEMLAGAPPFSGPTPQAILARKSLGPVPSLRGLREVVPDTVERMIMQALANTPSDRYSSAVEFAGALNRAHSETVSPRPTPVSAWRFLFRTRVGMAVLIVLLGVSSASAWALLRSTITRWALDKALPEIQRLIDLREIVAAYRLVRRVEPYVSSNPDFQRLWLESTVPISIRTTPAGARVYITDYRTTTDDWFLLGTSPIEGTRIPASHLRFRVEKAGFQIIEAGSANHFASPVIEFVLQSETEHPDMIHVPGGLFEAPLLPPVRLEPYWLDRYEVTNRAFKEFVDRGGYREPKFWAHELVLEGGVVPWEHGIRTLLDRTGRPGPSTWEIGSYPDGTADFPVSGVSWYEAAAYCQYAVKKLPTLYHWYSAAGLTQFSDILALSNLRTSARARDRPAVVGVHGGIGPYGHYDMAGNVREWVLNPTGGRRYILGGAWSDPGYAFYQPDASMPGNRSPKNGFRCASYSENLTEVLGAEVEAVTHKHERRIVDDEVFRLYRNLYIYEPIPLNPKVESVDGGPPHWRRETVSFDAPYGDERIIAHLFLPKQGKPPYHAVLHFPPGAAFRLQSSRDLHTKWFDLIVRTGRVVVYPVVEGTYERHATHGLLRERIFHWSMDIGRSIDYLQTRDDIDTGNLAYYGFGTGALYGPIFTAIEDRFKVSIFLAGGLPWEKTAPEIDPANFAPRAKVPVLMLNGQDDFFFPVETAQRPLFRLLGASHRDKSHVVVEGGTVPDDWQAVAKEMLDWLDRYLGPVK